VTTLADTQALGRFLAATERRAFRIAQIATGSREDALDIVQDSMLKLAERYSAKPEQQWKPLFYRILQSKIRDWQRRNRVRMRFRGWLGRSDSENPLEDPIQTVPDPHGRDPEQESGQDRALVRLEAALRQLPARQQQTFLLRAWEGMNVAQTAQAMGISAGSVKTHYHRAVRTLREVLGDEDE